MGDSRLPFLDAIERKALWLSTWMIHNANHIRPNHDGLKVGGHQASSASVATILTALYAAVLRPQDRVAVKPHASPIFHALQYLMGNQTREKLENFRAFGGAQSYPSRTKDIDDVDFSTGSVGLGVSQTLFASLVQDYVHAHGWNQEQAKGRMIAVMGDAEMDEGNIFESLLEGWKHNVRNTWWVIDYNRQSLDGVIREGLYARFEDIFKAFGWDVVVLKHGALQRAAFAEPGGEKLRDWIDSTPNQLYSALTFQGAAAWRKRLLDDIGDQGDVTRLIERRSDEELARLMTNLGGHDMQTVLEAFERIDHDRPTVFIAYTIKGCGLPLAGHKDNHAGMLTPAQLAGFQQSLGVREGHEWDKFEGLSIKPRDLEKFLAAIPFNRDGTRRRSADPIAVPDVLTAPKQAELSTQQGFGLLLNEIARSDDPIATRIVTTSPDVTVSTNLGPWVNRRGLFAKDEMNDLFRAERIPSTFNWHFSDKGQHMELGIAEMNLFLMLSGLGLSHQLFGERLLPIGTLYDPFIQRGLDALNYACYQDARFMVVATPSGVSLAGEGGAHQSISTPLIGMAQDGLASYEPAFVDELAAIMRFGFHYLQWEDIDPGARDALRPSWMQRDKGGALYLRLSTRTLEQPSRPLDAERVHDIIEGAYWMRKPGPNAQVVIAYTGVVAPEAIEAVGRMAEDRRDVGLLAVTSADRLHAGWTDAGKRRDEGDMDATSHIESLLAGLPSNCALVTVVDGHPATLAWLGSVLGHRTRALGVEHFGQTGTIADLYRHFGIDTRGIITAAQSLTVGRPIRYLRAI